MARFRWILNGFWSRFHHTACFWVTGRSASSDSWQFSVNPVTVKTPLLGMVWQSPLSVIREAHWANCHSLTLSDPWGERVGDCADHVVVRDQRRIELESQFHSVCKPFQPRKQLPCSFCVFRLCRPKLHYGCIIFDSQAQSITERLSLTELLFFLYRSTHIY